MSMTSNNPINSLMKFVIEGNEDQAVTILENVELSDLEKLLQHRTVVTDFSGRLIEGTAFQLALGAEDVEMCEVLTYFFKKIPDGSTLQLNQYQSQFPDNQKSDIDANSLQAIENIFAAIGKSSDDEACKFPLIEFRSFFRPGSVIKSGRHFDVRLLVEALKLYKKNYLAFGEWNSRQNNLCWAKVIGYIERQLPSCYAQAFCQGLVNIVHNKEPLQRSFHFLEENYELFPLDTIPTHRLGYEFAGGQWGLWDGKASADRAIATAQSLQTYIEQKRQRLITLC